MATRTRRSRAAEINERLLTGSLVQREIQRQGAFGMFARGFVQKQRLIERDEGAPLIDGRPLDADGAGYCRLIAVEMGENVRLSHRVGL